MFGYKTQSDDILTYDSLEKAIGSKVGRTDCSMIMYKPTLAELLVILKQG